MPAIGIGSYITRLSRMVDRFNPPRPWNDMVLFQYQWKISWSRWHHVMGTPPHVGRQTIVWGEAYLSSNNLLTKFLRIYVIIITYAFLQQRLFYVYFEININNNYGTNTIIPKYMRSTKDQNGWAVEIKNGSTVRVRTLVTKACI